MLHFNSFDIKWTQKDPAKYASIRVNADSVLHTMRGVSEHRGTRCRKRFRSKMRITIIRSGFRTRAAALTEGIPRFREENVGSDCRHASWLGLNFIRVELSQRMYEPERDVFDWNNEEMLALYKILDWCESNNADVFLQQMWGHVEWNAFYGVHPLLSAPRSLDDFAAGITGLLDRLLHKKKYTCIKYLSIANEPPGGTWGYWWSFGQGSGTITPALKKVREYLDAAGVKIPLSGPDWTSLPPLDPGKIDLTSLSEPMTFTHTAASMRTEKKFCGSGSAGRIAETSRLFDGVRQHEPRVGRGQSRTEKFRSGIIECIRYTLLSQRRR